jgi:hypothetical protein
VNNETSAETCVNAHSSGIRAVSPNTDDLSAAIAGRRQWASRSSLAAIVAALVLVASILGWASHRAGSLRGAVQYLSGADVIVGPSQVTVSGQSQDRAEIIVRNLAKAPVRIVGYNSQCSCIQLENLPIEIPASGERRISLHANTHDARVVGVVLLADRAAEVPLRFDVKVVPGISQHQ